MAEYRQCRVLLAVTAALLAKNSPLHARTLDFNKG